jgi:hypothetical protein
LVSPGPLLHSDVFGAAVWLIIMAKVCHYWSSSIFSLDDIDESGL